VEEKRRNERRIRQAYDQVDNVVAIIDREIIMFSKVRGLEKESKN